jgi:glycosyltransferase involved in cell wall biosynthesis
LLFSSFFSLMSANQAAVLITAYAVNPYKGSEDGMGWNFVRQAARFNRVLAVTRRNNRPAIERYIAENPALELANITFWYFDLPAWMRWWKRGPLLSVLYFYMWQIGLALWLWRKRPAVDLVHNLNFHNDWTPSFLWLLQRPLVWGPIGHHPPIPMPHLRPYGTVALLKDRALWLLKCSFWRLDPFLWFTRRKARQILCMNSSVAPRLRLVTNRFSIVPSVAVELPSRGVRFEDKDQFVVMIAARMVPLKGFDMVVRAFALFYDRLQPEQRERSQLLLIGSGPEEGRVRQLVAAAGISHCTQLLPWVEREKLLTIYELVSIFFFPSHEGAGMVVAEAMSYGVPVLCYENVGPGELVPPSSALKVPYASYEENTQDFALRLLHIFNNPDLLQHEASLAHRHVATHHTWDQRGQQLRETYKQALSS